MAQAPSARAYRVVVVREDEDGPSDDVLIGGREQVVVVVVDHDPAWAVQDEQVRSAVERALPKAVVRHIGSTSVPGLASKPIVDVLLVLPSVEDEAAYVPALERAGLVLRVREAGHRMLRTPARDVHLHVVDDGGPQVHAYLALRDRLRASAIDRELYAGTKRELARREWACMDDYADAKSDVIAEILGRTGRLAD